MRSVLWRVVVSITACCLPSLTFSQDNCGFITKRGFPMAAVEEDLDLFSRSIAGSNTALFLKLRQEGRAKISEAGVEVCIVEKKEADKIRIRAEQGGWEMWTFPEAVRKPGSE